MRVLLVKLSSLGDVVHTLPAAMDIRTQCPEAKIDWVVEPAFADLLRSCSAIDQVIEMDLRRWRKSPWSQATRQAWSSFRTQLQSHAYDWVIDLQGLTKSALVSRLARLTSAGQRVAMAHPTDGSSYELPTRWVADRCISVRRHIHAIERAREVCAEALGYALPTHGQLAWSEWMDPLRPKRPEVLCVHGTSRADKLWPEASWLSLGKRLLAQGLTPVFVHGNAEELARSERLAQGLPGSRIAPRWSLSQLLREMTFTRGVIGVDSGPSHMAVALGLPHVQIYNFDTAWRTGPLYGSKQISVFDAPTPGVDSVWRAWTQVMQGEST
jgi:heptosyltransferase-1